MKRKRRPPPPGDPKKAVGYLRVSTQEQHLGPEAQRTAILEWARTRGVEVVAWSEDHVSGALDDEHRPAWPQALKHVAEHGAGYVVVHRRDRLARDAIIAAHLDRAVEQVGAYVESADGVGEGKGPGSKLVRRIVDATAEYEHAMIKGRVKDGLAVKKARGELTGSVPYGKRLLADGVHLENCPEEQAVIARAVAWRAEGRSLEWICVALKQEGMMPREGKYWYREQITRMLRGAGR